MRSGAYQIRERLSKKWLVKSFFTYQEKESVSESEQGTTCSVLS